MLRLGMVFEGGVWWVAFRAFRAEMGDRGLFEAIRASKDPTVFTVLFGDTAALLGLALATLGIFLAQVVDLPVLDGVASVVIGLILAGTAAFLALECRSLLTGEGVAPSMSHRTHYGIRHTQNWNAEFWFQEARVPCANFFARSYFMLVAGQRPPSP